MLTSLLLCADKTAVGAGAPTTRAIDPVVTEPFRPLRAWWYEWGKLPNSDANPDVIRRMQATYAAHPDDADVIWWTAVAQSKELFRTDLSYVELVTRAADKGHPTAMAWLGHMYLYGVQVAPDPARGLQLLEQALAKGEPTAMAELGAAHGRGAGGLRPDPAAAEKLLRQAADAGYVGAHYKLSELYQKRDPLKALEELQRGATRGDVDAMATLADVYREGKLGVKPDPRQAILWMQRAAEGGRPAMQRELAKALISGYAGAKQDANNINIARVMLESASRAKDAEAMRMLAHVHLNGQLGLPISSDKGVQLLESAGAQGDPVALFELGQLYFEGISVTRDAARGTDLVRKSAEMGYQPAVRMRKRLEGETTRPTAGGVGHQL